MLLFWRSHLCRTLATARPVRKFAAERPPACEAAARRISLARRANFRVIASLFNKRKRNRTPTGVLLFWRSHLCRTLATARPVRKFAAERPPACEAAARRISLARRANFRVIASLFNKRKRNRTPTGVLLFWRSHLCRTLATARPVRKFAAERPPACEAAARRISLARRANFRVIASLFNKRKRNRTPTEVLLF